MDTLSLLYRGRLSSCNYDCPYCPFAKHKDSRAALAADAADLARLVAWLEGQADRRFNLLFTPWGEALTRRHYRDAIVRLSHLPQIARVAVQTNLSNRPDWLAAAAPGKVSLWCSFHPGETPRERFLERVGSLSDLKVPYSIGMVGIRAFFNEIGYLRGSLQAETYLWINAYWDEGRRYYRRAEIDWLKQIDPWFSWNHAPPTSRGAVCLAGETVLSVDGDGELQRCHFVPRRLGNLYRDDLETLLKPRACPNPRCDCYIGYSHRPDLPFQREFGLGALGRVPPDFRWQAPEGWSPAPPAVEAGRERNLVPIRVVAH